MIPSIDIWRCAVLMIKRHGDTADIEAAARDPGASESAVLQAAQSLSFVDTPQDASALHNAFKSHMDQNDGLVVTEITNGAGWAVSGIPQTCIDWLRVRRP